MKARRSYFLARQTGGRHAIIRANGARAGHPAHIMRCRVYTAACYCQPFFGDRGRISIMFPNRTFLAAVALASISGCDPQVNLKVQQSLQPPPQLDCLASALASSPDVVDARPMEPTSRAEGFVVTLRDSTSNDGLRRATLRRVPPPDSGRVLALNFAWVGHVRHPPLTEEQAVTTLGRRVLSHLRTACAPNSSTEVTCVYSDLRRAQSCG